MNRRKSTYIEILDMRAIIRMVSCARPPKKAGAVEMRFQFSFPEPATEKKLSMSTEIAEPSAAESEQSPNGQLSLSTAAARNLATTTKTPPQMQAISSRWLLKVLPWVQVGGGTYRVNRRLSYTAGDGKITFVQSGSDVRVVPAELAEMAALRGFDDAEALDALAGRFGRQEFSAGDTLFEQGQPADRIILIAHGRLQRTVTGPYGDPAVLDVLADGDHISYQALEADQTEWPFTVRALTATTVLTASKQAFEQVADQSESLRAHAERYRDERALPQNRRGEADITVSSGHDGEPELAGTFVDYELAPREYQLSVAQTVLRVHTRVADLFNDPMNQTEEQLRLTVEALRERQENEMINNREFGLLHNTAYEQRVQARSGPPTPDDLDELLSRRRNTQYLLAHPRTIAAFGRECTRMGIYPDSVEIGDGRTIAWRGVPLLSCNKIKIGANETSHILALRTGEENQGVVGLHQAGIPDEYQPSVSVRFMGINDQAIISYLVSAYYSVAVLVPDAVGLLENVSVAPSAG